MNKKRVDVLGKLILVMLVFVMAAAQDAKADELDDLKQQLAEQQKMLLKMQQRLDQLERQQAAPVAPADKKQLEQMVTKMFEEKKSDFVAPDWVNRIKWSGDFRYRYEGFDDTDNGVNDKRNRNRIRARLGLKAKLNDEWDTIFRIASGSSESPTSTNQTIGDSGGNDQGDAFSSKGICLDLAYADWHPESYPGLNVFMGKMKNPFYKVGKNQLIWDGDVNPEGGAFSYGYDVGDSAKATLVGGAFWLQERDEDADAGYFGIQARLKQKLDADRHWLAGVSYYDIGNIDGETVPGSLGTNFRGNTAAAGGTTYRYDYDIVEGFAEYGWKFGETPMSVFGSYVENLAAPSNRNTGFLVGFKVNKANKPGSWEFGYNYRDIESDAVFAGLNDSDFIDGGTDGVGHKLNYKYQLAKNVQGGLTLFLNDRKRPGERNEKFERLQADLIFKF